MSVPTNRPLPPPPPGNGNRTATAPATPPPAAGKQRTFAVVTGKESGAQRVLIYGPGGVGKTTLASLIPDSVFLDVGDSTDNMPHVPRIMDSHTLTFNEVRACLQSSAFDGCKAIILDDWTSMEEKIRAHVLETITNDRNQPVSSIEGYGFGKGYQHIYEQALLLFADLERQVAAGRHVVIVAHDCTTNVPNPMSEDFIRFEPFMQTCKGGKASIRERAIQWVGHVLFVGYDVATEKGKGKGSGTRAIWTYELPTHRAKSRTISEILPYEHARDGRIWDLILKGAR